MAFSQDRSGRVGRGKYWTLFAANIIVIPALLVGGLVELSRANIGLGMLLILAILPVGIYWRVTMMRRCRDIGWPAFLPWLFFGAQMMASFQLSPLRGHPGAALPLLFGMLAIGDFVFTILIGCIKSRETVDYAGIFGDGPVPGGRLQPAAATPAGGGGTDRFDEAIARALEANRRGESVLDGPARRAPAPVARAPGGFGRRIV